MKFRSAALVRAATTVGLLAVVGALWLAGARLEEARGLR